MEFIRINPHEQTGRKKNTLLVRLLIWKIKRLMKKAETGGEFDFQYTFEFLGALLGKIGVAFSFASDSAEGHFVTDDGRYKVKIEWNRYEDNQ